MHTSPRLLHAVRVVVPRGGEAGPLRLVFWLRCLALLLLGGSLLLPGHAQTPHTPHTAASTTGHIAIGKANRYVLSNAFTVFEDKGAQLGLDEILKPSVQARFLPVRAGATATNFGLTKSAFWLRLSLDVQPDAPAQWLFEVAYPPLDHLELYIARPDGSFERQAGGDLLPFAERKIPHRNHVLPVSLQAGQANTVYLRVTSEGTVAAPVRLWQPAALWAHDQLEYSVLSLYFGMLVGLFLYNLLLFVSLRDRVYLFYVAFVAWIDRN